MQRTAAFRSVSGGSFADLNEDLLGDETLVAYAAAAGTTAADGRGRNSPYTAALLSHLETPLEIGLLFRRVRAQVLASTALLRLRHVPTGGSSWEFDAERQQPGERFWYSAQLRDDGVGFRVSRPLP